MKWRPWMMMTLVYLSLPTALSWAEMPAGPPPADGHHARWEQHHEAQEAKIFDQLNLSPEQRQKLQAIKQQSRQQARQIHQQMKQQREGFETYLFSPAANQAEAERRVAGFSQQMNEMGRLRVQTLFKMREVMTPEQFQKFGQLQQARWADKKSGYHGQHAKPNAD